MSLTKVVIRMLLIACMVLGGRAALAGPARCSVNNQDSTCVGRISTAWQTAPTCPTDAGWTTVVPASWIGSQYSAPQCNYQAPPTCPSGYDETPPASWNGSSWAGLSCTPRSPPPPPDPTVMCQAQVPSPYTASTPFTHSTQYDAFAAQVGYPGDIAFLASGYGPVYQNECGNNHYEYGLACFVTPSNTFAGWYIFASNTTTCGGTH
jgi:hypothetical protein